MKPETRLGQDDGEETTPLLDDAGRSDPEGNPTSDKSPSAVPLPWSQILTAQSTLILAAYALLALHNLAFDSLFPVFLDQPPQDLQNNPEAKLPFKFSGGFGMST